MGKNSRNGKSVHVEREKKTTELIHRTKLFGGKQTAEEVHRELAWGPMAVCQCGRKDVVIQIDGYASPKELLAHLRPEVIVRLMVATEDGQLPTFPTKYGPMVNFSKAWACEDHKQLAEQTAARLPSWVLVEIDRGPGKDKVVVQVPTLITKAS